MALQAAASGIPYTPVPGLIGTDLLRRRADWKLADDPFHPGAEIVLVPALAPDFAVVHGVRADPVGNVVIGIRNDDRLLIQAARRVIVTVEQVSSSALDSLRYDEQVIPAAYIDLLAEVPGGGVNPGEVERYLEREAGLAVATPDR
jgi:glutaconate CoA-transferase subunit A